MGLTHRPLTLYWVPLRQEGIQNSAKTLCPPHCWIWYIFLSNSTNVEFDTFSGQIRHCGGHKVFCEMIEGTRIKLYNPTRKIIHIQSGLKTSLACRSPFQQCFLGACSRRAENPERKQGKCPALLATTLRQGAIHWKTNELSSRVVDDNAALSTKTRLWVEIPGVFLDWGVASR